MDFSFTLWDVEHGLSIWIQTPSGQNHCIDAGHNSETDFSPFERMKNFYKVNNIDYLIISHPDKDHIEGLPNFIKYLDKPKTFTRNETLPYEMKYGSCDKEYQKIFKNLDSTYTYPVSAEKSPKNEQNNGNVKVYCYMNTYHNNMKCNDTSIVVIYKYKNWVFICPGDIEPTGWEILKRNYAEEISEIINKATIILVAPHHGRPSAYCNDMIDFLHPNLILISDKYGKHITAPQYYICASGIPYGGSTIKSLSTKTKGRIRISIDETGNAFLNTAS